MTTDNKQTIESPDIESIVEGMGRYADSHRVARSKITRISRLTNRIRHRAFKGSLILFVAPVVLVAFVLLAAMPWIILLSSWMSPILDEWLVGR